MPITVGNFRERTYVLLRPAGNRARVAVAVAVAMTMTMVPWVLKPKQSQSILLGAVKNPEPEKKRGRNHANKALKEGRVRFKMWQAGMTNQERTRRKKRTDEEGASGWGRSV